MKTTQPKQAKETKMNSMRFWIVATATAALTVGACQEVIDDGRYELDAKPILMGNGVRMIPVGPVTFSERSPRDIGVDQEDSQEAINRLQAAPTMMGARMLRNGIQYVTAEDFRVDGPARNTDSQAGRLTATKGDIGTTRSPLIVGSDNRYHVTTSGIDSWQWPWSTSVENHHTTGSSCSGSLIGPHTVVTAAHCFFVPPNTWFATAFFAPGADLDGALGTYPYGQLTSWVIWIPGGYAQKADDYDFAVVDLSGSGLNGGPGWLGTVITNFPNPIAGLRSGYDQDKQTPTAPHQWASGDSMWNPCNNQSGPPPPCSFVYHNMDTENWASGSGLYLNQGADAGKLAGIHTAGVNAGIFGKWNKGTHWYTWTYNFVHAVDSHWP